MIMTSKISALDLFCGAGGLSLGFEMAGFDVVLGVDSDARCIETYSQNLRGSGIVRDVAQIRDPRVFLESTTGLKRVDVIIGGPPCQTFSPVGRIKLRSLGRDPGRDPRAELWRHFLRFVRELRPDWFVMENVPGMASVKYNGCLLPDAIVEAARKMGYVAEWRILQASHYGVPQTRKRIFIVGNRADYPIPWPEKISDTPVTVWDAISDLPIVPHGFREFDILYEPRGRRTEYQKLMRNGAGRKLYNHVTRWHREEDLLAFSLLPEGGKYTDLPKRLRRYRDDIFQDRYRKLRRDAPSWTIDAHISKDTYRYIYPSRDGEPEPPRTISVREAARLQSFPDRFIFPKALTHAFRQIGNAVPPLMAKAVGDCLIKCL